MHRGLFSFVMAGFFFATMPASTHYGLNNYGFGSGGTGNSSSTNYSLNATTGETSNVQSTSTTYKARSGNNNVQQAAVPAAPTFTNGSSWYNKLHFIINAGTAPSDTKFSIAISSDNFTTTQYIQPDDTVGSSFVITDFQTYAGWGSSTGQYVTGLSPSTAYKIKVNAIQGKFTQSEYGPTASAATVAPNISFGMYTDSQPTAPFSTSFGNLLPATVTNSADRIWVNLSTNAESGAEVYLSSANAGLTSASKSFTIASATADLAAASSGYGAQGLTATQSSGGPLSITSPYNVSASNVGLVSALIQEIYVSSVPVTGGNASMILKAKATALTPESNDYKDTLTLTAAAAF